MFHKFGFHSIEFRVLRSDQIEVFKMIRGFDTETNFF